MTTEPKTDSPVRARADLIQEEYPDSPAGRVYAMRSLRRKQILDLVRRHGSMSRVEIANRLSHNIRTASECVDELVHEGLLTEERERKQTPPQEPFQRNPIGRPPIPVYLNTSAACALGIEFGRQHLACQAFDLGNQLLGKSRIEINPAIGSSAVLSTFEKFLSSFLRKYGEKLPPVAGVGVTFAGVYYKMEGEHEILDPLPQAVVDSVGRTTGAPVVVHEGTAMLTLGELWFCQQRPLSTFAAIHICEGLGAAIVEKGRLWLGYEKRGGDLGHLQLGDRGVKCFCGRNACLENIASSTGLERLAEKAGITKQGKPARVEDLAHLAREGDAAALKIWSKFGKALGTGIDTLVVLTNPETVIVSGPVSRYADLFIKELMAQVEEGALPRFRRSTKIVVSELQEDAVCAGACACILRRVFGATHEYMESLV